MNSDRDQGGGSGRGMPAALRRMREMWRIPDEKPKPEAAPTKVAHDIYCVPDHKPTIPQRHISRRKHHHDDD